MGEQVNKEPKQEEKAQQKAEEVEVEVEEELESSPPPPFVFHIDLHCVGCAKKIERILSKMRGIEGVVIDMAQNQVTLKGLVEPQAICNTIMKKTKRVAKVLSPLPAPDDDKIPEIVPSQATEPITVELDVNMHCEACADQLKRKILKMKGVQNVETELRSSKVTVTGTMDPKNLVDYVYRRTKKQAKIVVKPEPAPSVEEKKKEEKHKSDEPAAMEEGKTEHQMAEAIMSKEEEVMMKMSYLYPFQQPLYVVERLPPAPQMFSDENPNACSIC
ncbi:hypothetical protein QQ045_012947 [Rhodiola kirilowii]